VIKKIADNKVRLLHLDSLRGAASLMVVLHHALLQVNFAGVSLTDFQYYFLVLFRNGHYPVNFFIVLSGYSLMIPLIKNNYQLTDGALYFFKRRAKRILPTYYLAVLASLLLIVTLIGEKTGSHWDIAIPVTRTDIITHALLIHDVFLTTVYKINHAFWSIAVEWRIYFLFPAILYLWRRLGATKTVAIVAVVSFALVAALKYLHGHYSIINNTSNGISPHYLLLFALGMFGADVALSPKDRFPAWKTSHWLGGLVVLTFFLLGLALVPERYAIRFPWQIEDIVVGLWSICLLNVCNYIQHSKERGSSVKKVLSWKPLVTIGTFGYSLYLMHAPFLQVLTQYMLNPLHLPPFTQFLLLITVGLLLVLLMSYGFFLLCEKPFMTKKQPSLAIAAIVEPAI
jgi:peptidoglycan/LPS O-acetylase OafA/YrhL